MVISGYFFGASSLKKSRLSEPYEPQKTCKFFPKDSSRKVPEGREIFFCSKFPLWRSDSGLSQLVGN